MADADSTGADHARPGRWLSIVGLGEDGVAGLSPRARVLIAGAARVYGGRRHLALAGELLAGEAVVWPTPFEAGLAEVLARRGRPVCVLASGDPFLFGVGASLARHVDPAEMEVVPAPSAFSLAASRLGWALPEVSCLSLCGRPLDLLRPHLHDGRRILALSPDAGGPAAVAALLAARGFGGSRLQVLEALGGPRERRRATVAAAFALTDIDPLNLVAIEVVAGADARVVALTPGRPDELYEHDGQLTRHEMRALTLAALAPRRGELLWDIGAGAGSVGIEWMLVDPSLRAIGIEERAERAARARRNAAALGVPGLVVVEGRAPDALAGLPVPDAIFIGGGASEPGVLDAAVAALRPGGRLAANAVTLETEALLLARHARQGGDLLRVALSRAAPVAGMTGWRPAMPVTRWSWVKP
ncbi:precorrin-6y C5,15-methyltransferase (decarboxylating) subunit CbiE [Ancylobacter lacus]|uniref:precorrin-6y C5,15-methyltransferase (decarboxylating) subunit CbiE n=1 Tax=Ancylobacter lacus TaxID=2579970 RepID=UPI001BD09F7A|nr:precorrin-6y C5,15-methyltransferase (decarboxylating) subunit CbiE [Ancylobacter lacus]MBS7537849.1 precorrin-6y C5,15-methyltransferase (decarboxylating) subunit CbiE [Ancylobacter lacus]